MSKFSRFRSGERGHFFSLRARFIRVTIGYQLCEVLIHMKPISVFALALCLLALSLCPSLAAAESLSPDEMRAAEEAAPLAGDPADAPSAARADFIDRILLTARSLYEQADGRARRAQYSGDIYVCKNFTVHLFRETRDDFRIAAFPDVELVIPNNQKKADCAPYVYGVEWQDVPASEGNPFYAAASFRYDDALSREENRENARAFLRQVQRGDYFQMAANYYYGVGAHSMVFTADYDPEADAVRWTDSNMKGKTVNGERYAYVQYDAVKEIDWFVDAFCRKKYGATIYRLRDDIIYAP